MCKLGKFIDTKSRWCLGLGQVWGVNVMDREEWGDENVPN